MKMSIRNQAIAFFAMFALSPIMVFPQDEKPEATEQKEKPERKEAKELKELKELKEEKDLKEPKERKESERVIITRNADNTGKTIIEINGDKVTVNGKDVNEMDDDDVTVVRQKIKDRERLLSGYSSGYAKKRRGSDNYNAFTIDADRAMLGVGTSKHEKGVEVTNVTKESGAEKAGLKTGDVITTIDKEKIQEPDDLSSVIRSHKPGDKVAVTYLREGKEKKATVELTKFKGMVSAYAGADAHGYPTGDGQNFNFDWKEFGPSLEALTPRISWGGQSPRLGLSVQDAEDGKGVTVISVDEDGNAGKAGIKEDDVILEVDGKTITDADTIARIMKESKEKISVKMKVSRSGKTQDIDVKVPRKLKKAEL